MLNHQNACPQRLAGKVALVTGAAQGLGEAIARVFIAQGCRVFLADIQEQKLAALCGELGKAAEPLLLDVTRQEDWQQAVTAIEERAGRLHVLVNNAGIAAIGDICSTSYEEFRRVQTLDVDSVFLGCQMAMPLLEKAGEASIINMSSVSGLIASGNTLAYNTAKAAVTHLSKSVALYCAGKRNGVRCNSVHPVFADTPILDGLVGSAGQAGLEKLARQIPLGELLRPEDVAYGVLYLASSESRMVTGSELVIDGGITAM